MAKNYSIEYEIKRDDTTINNLLNRLSEAIDEGIHKHPGMSYEQGQQDMFNWLTDLYGDPNAEPPY